MIFLMLQYSLFSLYAPYNTWKKKPNPASTKIRKIEKKPYMFEQEIQATVRKWFIQDFPQILCHSFLTI